MNRRKQTVLLVDDNAELVRSYQEILLGEGYQALTALNGREALKLLAAMPPPHLILLDCLMPGMSGQDFLDELARRMPEISAVTPVVGFSSFFEGSPLLEELRPHVRCIVEKPNDIDDFVAIVKRYVRPPESSD